MILLCTHYTFRRGVMGMQGSAHVAKRVCPRLPSVTEDDAVAWPHGEGWDPGQPQGGHSTEPATYLGNFQDLHILS